MTLARVTLTLLLLAPLAPNTATPTPTPTPTPTDPTPVMGDGERSSSMAEGVVAEPPLAGAGPGLHFVDVGQGAALLVVNEAGELILIDSGPVAGTEALARALADHGASTVELLIHTHHDADHIGGFSGLVAGVDRRPGTADDVAVAAIWDRGLDGELPDTEVFALYLGIAGERRVRPEPGQLFALGEVEVEVLDLDPPPANAAENQRGLALCLEVGELRALVVGDLDAARSVLAAEACGPVDLLWLGHHGAATSTSAPLIEISRPAAVVVSAGHGNVHCHPSELALALIRDRPAWILDGAGLRPGDGCQALAPALGDQHRVVGGDLWIDADLRAREGGAGGWGPFEERSG